MGHRDRDRQGVPRRDIVQHDAELPGEVVVETVQQEFPLLLGKGFERVVRHGLSLSRPSPHVPAH